MRSRKISKPISGRSLILARLYVIKKRSANSQEYNQSENKLKSTELRLEKLQDVVARQMMSCPCAA